MAKKIDEAAFEAANDFEEPIEADGQEEYDEDLAKEAGEALDEKIANDPRYESAPEGTAGMEDQERSARAARAKGDPEAGYSRIEREQLKQFGVIRAGKNAGASVADLASKLKPANAASDVLRAILAAAGLVPEEPGVGADDPMGLDVGGPRSESQPVEVSGEFLLVQSYGGAWNIYRFTHLNQVQGFVQNLPGLKRLFKRSATNKYQEINGRGLNITR